MISTTHSAILSLIVFLLNIPAPTGTKGVVYKEILAGRRTLEELSPRNTLADQYVKKLNIILGTFQDAPQPSPTPVFQSTIPGVDMRPSVTHDPKFSVTNQGIEDSPSCQSVPVAPQWSGPAARDGFIPPPHNLVFEYPYHGPHLDAIGNANSSFILPTDLLDQTPSFNLLYISDTSQSMGLNWDPTEWHNGASQYWQTIGASSTEQGLPQPLMSSAASSALPSLAPSMPFQAIGFGRPASFSGLNSDAIGLVPPMAGFAPEVDYTASFLGTFEPPPEQT
ncbi:hypothetical protein BJX64DRAFT_294518 [Aspergillus heterothallicus]